MKDKLIKAIQECIKADVYDEEIPGLDQKDEAELKEILVSLIDGFKLPDATPDEEDAELQRRLSDDTLTLYMEVVNEEEIVSEPEEQPKDEAVSEPEIETEVETNNEGEASVEQLPDEPETKAKQATKAKAKKAKKESKKGAGTSRIDAVVACLKERKHWKRKELVQASSDLYVSWGGKENLKEQQFMTYLVLKTLKALGLAEEKDGEVAYYG